MGDFPDFPKGDLTGPIIGLIANLFFPGIGTVICAFFNQGGVHVPTLMSGICQILCYYGGLFLAMICMATVFGVVVAWIPLIFAVVGIIWILIWSIMLLVQVLRTTPGEEKSVLVMNPAPAPGYYVSPVGAQPPVNVAPTQYSQFVGANQVPYPQGQPRTYIPPNPNVVQPASYIPPNPNVVQPAPFNPPNSNLVRPASFNSPNPNLVRPASFNSPNPFVPNPNPPNVVNSTAAFQRPASYNPNPNFNNGLLSTQPNIPEGFFIAGQAPQESFRPSQETDQKADPDPKTEDADQKPDSNPPPVQMPD